MVRQELGVISMELPQQKFHKVNNQAHPVPVPVPLTSLQ
ncbi:hypothetical protein COLO4_06087 [Corchorus olitorius]|uniref:Uncharacterized protein n=1 Tax=Corchorus olitorius TaxID=93759 RepID=A0A1R3KP14_9ROSI|nr:hypothetical protein COLO4_06087 [Corchorus olitorius]